MKKQIALGITFTIVIFLISSIISKLLSFDSLTLKTGIMLFLEAILSLGAIRYFKPDFHIKIPEFKKGIKVFFLGFLTVILTMIFVSIITKILIGQPVENEMHPIMKQMTVLQVFFYVFIGASIAEELLFRGFLLNMLQSLKEYGIRIFKWRLSVPVLISAFLFSMAHLGLLRMSSMVFVSRILVFTFFLGLVAGYFQEKYKNTSYAILVHMGGNLLGLLSMIVMHYIAK